MSEPVDTGVPDAEALILSDIARIDLRRLFEGDAAELGRVRFVLPSDQT
jgi:hypothetical protein